MSQQLGFFQTGARVVVDDAGGSIVYYPAALTPEESARLFKDLRAIVPWRSERRMMYDREVDVPRLVARMPIDTSLPSSLAGIVPIVERLAGVRFTSIGMNLYRDGRDSVAPHNDHLSELVSGEPIALVSVGASRRMTIRSKAKPRRTFDLDLEPGSLLLMSYQTQRTYDHGIPKTNQDVGPRISLAFRVRPHQSEKEPSMSDQVSLSFAKDIRPMFTDTDVAHMKPAGIDLSDADSVKTHADSIYRSVSSGAMPPPSSGESRWSAQKCETFKQWQLQGCPP